jgi:hypothetical protein
MRAPLSQLPLSLFASTLLLGLPAVARAEEPPQEPASLKVALDLGGMVGALHHPAAALPPDLLGQPRSMSQRNSAARASFGVQLAMSQFVHADNLWETNSMDWYLSGPLHVLAFRMGLEKEVPLSQTFSLGIGAHATAADTSIGTGQTTYEPSIPDAHTGPDAVTELRADKWLFGLGGTVSLLVLTHSPVYMRFQAGYTQYLDKARRFATQGKDYTPEGFSASLSGPSGGVSLGVRL